MNSVDRAPLACSSTPVTWLSVVTGMTSPLRGPPPIVRVARVWLAAPIVATTGPSRWTSAVT